MDRVNRACVCSSLCRLASDAWCVVHLLFEECKRNRVYKVTYQDRTRWTVPSVLIMSASESETQSSETEGDEQGFWTAISGKDVEHLHQAVRQAEAEPPAPGQPLYGMRGAILMGTLRVRHELVADTNCVGRASHSWQPLLHCLAGIYTAGQRTVQTMPVSFLLSTEVTQSRLALRWRNVYDTRYECREQRRGMRSLILVFGPQVGAICQDVLMVEDPIPIQKPGEDERRDLDGVLGMDFLRTYVKGWDLTAGVLQLKAEGGIYTNDVRKVMRLTSPPDGSHLEPTRFHFPKAPEEWHTDKTVIWQNRWSVRIGYNPSADVTRREKGKMRRVL